MYSSVIYQDACMLRICIYDMGPDSEWLSRISLNELAKPYIKDRN